MALAVTHVLVAIVLLDLARHYLFGQQRFPRYLVVIGGIAGLLPDIDIPLGWLLSFFTGTEIGLHRLFTHSLFFVFLFLLMGIIRQYQEQGNEKRWSKIFYVIAFGWFIHLVLDCLYGGSSSFLWPFDGGISFCPAKPLDDLYAMGIDAILLVAWLVHEEVQKKVKDYF